MNSDRRYRIKKSAVPHAGHGLFLRKSLRKGDELHVAGMLVKRNSFYDRCTRYADAYKFRVGSHLLIPLGGAGMINHSAEPNVIKVIRGKKVSLRALRPILSGEELFLTYSLYAQNRFYKNRRRKR